MNSADLIAMTRRALAGEVVIPPRFAGQMLDEFRRLIQLELQEANEIIVLSRWELEVLNQMALGKTDKEITQALSVSMNTVTTHLRNILSKLQVGSRKEAAHLVKNKGLLNNPRTN